MRSRRARMAIFVGLPLVLYAAVIPGCSSDSNALGELAHPCSLNSECNSPLACIFSRCHQQCNVSNDCPVGQRCVTGTSAVMGTSAFHVCQLPNLEDTCSADGGRSCHGTQTCGSDLQCRESCGPSVPCLSGRCVGSACFDPHAKDFPPPGGIDGGEAGSAKQVCDDACAALVACGSLQDPMCSAKCQNAGAAHVACVHATSNDCNGIATCILGTLCGGHPPAGTATCGATALCEGTCNAQNPIPACGCSCVAAMSPSTSFKLIVNNECANYVACPSCNPATFDGASCNACANACVVAGPCSHS